MSFINDDFMLKNKTAKELYEHVKDLPIIDYHCHLSPKEIFEDKPFENIGEIWLGGDHYKWRLMRNFGADERFITGDATNKEKFITYCTVLGTAFGNPLYHWSQVELKDFFNCDKEINAENAEAIWDECNAYIIANQLTPQKLIEGSNVKHLFTTNEVFDDLTVFEEIKKKGYNFDVLPAFRGDKIMNIDAANYLEFLKKLEDLTNPVKGIDDLEKALENRLNAFIAVSLSFALPMYFESVLGLYFLAKGKFVLSANFHQSPF
jgi:glucuronate isomerase